MSPHGPLRSPTMGRRYRAQARNPSAHGPLRSPTMGRRYRRFGSRAATMPSSGRNEISW